MFTAIKEYIFRKLFALKQAVTISCIFAIMGNSVPIQKEATSPSDFSPTDIIDPRSNYTTDVNLFQVELISKGFQRVSNKMIFYIYLTTLITAFKILLGELEKKTIKNAFPAY